MTNLISKIYEGGIMMIPILLCGLIATFIIIERLFFFYVTAKKDAKLMYDLKSSLGTKNFEAAKLSCVEAGTPTSQVIRKAIDCRNWNETDMKDVIEAEMELVIPKYEHLLTPLGTIASISTLLGLLGTVLGNIQAFSGYLSQTDKTGDLGSAIGVALITTVAGLVVSIPAVIFHNYFNSRVNRRIAEMECNVTASVIKISGREDKYEI